MITAFLIVACICFGWLFVAWSKDDRVNLFIKFIFFGMTVWGIICALFSAGILKG